MIKKIIIMSPIILTIILVGIFLFIGSAQKKKLISFPEPTSVPFNQSTIKKIDITGIKTNDFMSKPIRKTEDGSYLFIKSLNLEAVYYKSYGQFNLVISSSSAEVIKKAEDEFLKKLGINENEACRLDVIVNSPYVPNPDLSLPRNTLSFCDNY